MKFVIEIDDMDVTEDEDFLRDVRIALESALNTWVGAKYYTLLEFGGGE